MACTPVAPPLLLEQDNLVPVGQRHCIVLAALHPEYDALLLPSTPSPGPDVVSTVSTASLYEYDRSPHRGGQDEALLDGRKDFGQKGD